MIAYLYNLAWTVVLCIPVYVWLYANYKVIGYLDRKYSITVAACVVGFAHIIGCAILLTLAGIHL